MNANIPRDSAPDEDKDLRAELIAHFHLDSGDVEKIYDMMQTTDASFSEAAMRLGLVTKADVEDAMIRAQGGARPGESGLIETAIRRISSDRRVVLRQGERVTPGPHLVIAHEPDNPRSEHLRALRTELLLLNEGARGANIIAILSANKGEGRSQVAAELAIAFAQLGRRTLLVDADMRNPQQHRLFGGKNEYGLSKAITSFDKPVYHPVVGMPQMQLLTAGQIPPNPLELLSDGRFEKLMADWRNNCEFLILDTPPVSQCADGLAIATLAGQVLVLSRAQHSSFKSTRDMLRRLATTQAKILGAVLNHF